MTILGTRAKPVDDLPRDAPRGREAERILAGELLAELRHLKSTLTEWADRYAGQIVNNVLRTETATFDATGVVKAQAHVAAGCIEVRNLATPTAGGTPTSAASAAPAAGADITVTVPSGQTWTLQSFDASLTTSAAVANRVVAVVIDDGTNVLYRWVAGLNQTASQTLEYAGAVGGVDVGGTARNNVVTFPLAGITLPAGYRIRTITTAIQAGDQWTAARLGYLSQGPNGAHAVTVVTGQPGTAPTAGPTMYVVPAGSSAVIPLASRQVSIFGTTGDQVSFSLFTSAPRPAVT